MLQDLQYSSIAKVLESWELARQKFGCEEEVGTMILLNLFDQAPETKKVFGFGVDEKIEENPIRRMGLLVHASAMLKFLDSILCLLGPDCEIINEVMSGLGKRHQKRGVKKEHFPLLGLAIRDCLAEIMQEEWNDSFEDAWIEIFDELSEVITKEMD
jgi:hemoglobin-like flavoprotein